jgi:hypothetical protein
MLPSLTFGDKNFRWLVEIDEGICAQVVAGGCILCGGPLHRSDYPRKPRGGVLAAIGEFFSTRFSLCCGRDGCRRRATPPSVRFLGRRVYLGVAVVMATILSRAARSPREVKRTTGIPSRTVSRWRSWWQTGFVESRVYQEQRGRFLPPLEIEALPGSLLERFAGAGVTAATALLRTLGFLAPLTTASVPGGSRFVRAL